MDYITALARELLFNQGFSPVKDSSGNIIAENNSVLLFNSEWGRNCLIEIIAGDLQDNMSLLGRFNNGSSFLQNRPDIQEILHIYVYQDTPENAVIDIMNDFQLTDYRAGKFLRSIVVNLKNKQVHVFTKDPSSQNRIRKVLDSQLSNNAYNEQDKSNTFNTGEIIKLLSSDEYALARKQAQIPISRKAPVLSWTLLGINVLIFLLMEMSGGSENNRTLINFGAKFNPAIQSGEYWRLFTPLFLHIGYLHLLVNCFSLYNLRIIENIYGTTRFLFIYLAAGITGNWASYMFSPSLSAGASGAIFGLMGSLLYIWRIKPRAYARIFGSSVITVIAANIVFGLTNPGIDNFAHIGGLIGGYFAAQIVRLPKTEK